MNCQSFGNVVVDLVRSQPLEADVRDQALSHSEGCETCAKRLVKEKSLNAGLRLLATEMKSSSAPDLIEQNLISALRQQKLAGHKSQGKSGWRYLAVAAALIFVVALAVAVMRMRQSPPAESHAQSSPLRKVLPTPQATQSNAQGSNPVAPKETRKVAAKHRSPKLRPSEQMRPTFVSVVAGAITDSQTPEVATTFMPLSYANAANMQDGAQVVRVELPRYAMARFGLPVNMERYDERVKADVWVGSDGLARAIRFVQ